MKTKILTLLLVLTACSKEQVAPTQPKTYTNVLGDWVINLPTNNFKASFTIINGPDEVTALKQTTNTIVEYKTNKWSKGLIINSDVSNYLSMATMSNINPDRPNSSGAIVQCYECKVNTTFTSMTCNRLLYSDENNERWNTTNIRVTRP